MLENLRNALDNGECAVGIFLDFQKAFDTGDHDILLNKLYNYCIRGVALEWFKIYISNRYQVVKYNDYESEARKILCGVPQGSILGPLLFLIYMYDLPMVSSLFMPILFADDTKLFCTNDKLDILVSEINVELVNIHTWLRVNKLSLNIEKTNFMLFTPNGFSRNMNCIKIDGHRIEEVRQTKFLGVILDNKLNWHAHCEYICGKMSKGIGTVETLYSTIYYSKYFIELNFDKSTQYVALWTHKRHPIPRPFGRAMECPLWVLQQKLTVL